MRVGVAAVIFLDVFGKNHIVMGRRGKDPNRGLFVLPGGAVESGETLEVALKREIFEETGLKIDRAFEPWMVVEIPSEQRLVLVARAFVKTPELKSGSDLYDVQWVDVSSLPKDISPLLEPLLLGRLGFTIEGTKLEDLNLE